MTDPTNLQEETKKKEGRPPIWTSPEVLKKLVDNYFENEKKPTLAGLALALDISRSTLYNYGEKDEFLDIIKKARERVEKHYEDLLIYNGTPTGVIFALKNMGWADRLETDLTTKGKEFPTPILGGISVPENNSNPENK
jgi:hypothetical protein